MKSRRMIAVLLAAMALTLASITAVFAASSGQATDPGANGNASDTPAAEHQPEARPGKPYLGLIVTKLNDRTREILGLPEDLEGAAVIGATPGSPADQAGFQRGDVVLTANGEEIESPKDLNEVLKTLHAGDTLTITFVRDGERHTVDVVVGDRHQEQPNRLPHWLRDVHHLANQHPNTLDVTFRTVDDEGTVHENVATPGTINGYEDGTLGIEMRDGNSVRYELGDDVIIVTGKHRGTVDDLQEGRHVVVVERDGRVRAVVVTGRADPDGERIDFDHLSDLQPNPQRAIVDRFRAEMSERAREAREARGAEQADELRERVEKLQERLQALLDGEDGDADDDNDGVDDDQGDAA